MPLGPAESARLQRSLDDLFDCHVETAHGSPELVDEALFPEELAVVAHAVAKRRAEFGVGRLCAKRALAALGIVPAPLLPNRHRAPAWPAGIVGSIAHTTGYCAAVVTRTAEADGIGLDVERDVPLEETLEQRICIAAERRWLDGQPAAERGRLGMLIFSAKEAFYKCQHPITEEFLGFQDVELALDLEQGRFEIAAITRPGRDWDRVRRARGRFRREEGLILAGATL
jgi:4'-phosphopantetheinyl transferase EntD